MQTDYGLDVSTIPDLDQAFGLVSGQTALAQSLARRLQTPRGSLPFNPEDGICVSDWLHEGATASQLFRLGVSVEAELEKDERVASVSCVPGWDSAASALRLSISVEPVVGRRFSMTALVSDFDFRLIGLQG